MTLQLFVAYKWLTYLQIFFPRSIASEIAAKEAAQEAARERRLAGSKLALSRQDTNGSGQSRLTANRRYLLHSSPGVRSDYSPEKGWDDEYSRDSQALSVPSSTMPFRPNRRTETGEIELAQGVDSRVMTLSEENLFKHNNRMSKLNHLVYNYTSPIGKFTTRLVPCYRLFILLPIDLASSPYATREIPMDARGYH